MWVISSKKSIRRFGLLFVLALVIIALFLSGGVLLADEAPDPPTGLSASKTGSGIRLSWTAPEGEVTGYRILRRRPAQGEGSLKRYVGDTGSSATSYTDTNVTIDAELYIYRVLALRGDLKSARSERVMIEVGPGDFGTSAQPAATPLQRPTRRFRHRPTRRFRHRPTHGFRRRETRRFRCRATRQFRRLLFHPVRRRSQEASMKTSRFMSRR